MKSFTLPSGMRGRFAVVKLWPTLKVAEDEVIARLKKAAAGLGLECVEMLSDGRALAFPHAPITRRDVDFAIHLHFETPKAYDLFSFVALWNPTRLILNCAAGEFVRVSRHLASHDDFLSCASAPTDDHVRRALLGDPTRDGPAFEMFHSLAQPILEPTVGEGKIFYVGINWERLGGAKGRHQELLQLLDTTGKMRIYGPQSIHGVEVWKGYESFVGPLPFDGESVVHALHDAGIGLVLGSASHKEAGLMSCRLFETVAAGAVVICDEHPFARKHFGDTLLYVDTTGSAQDTLEQVLSHHRWIVENSAAAIDLARRAQAIFRARFALDISLRAIYEGFAARKQALDLRLAPPVESPTTLFLLLPVYDREALSRHIETAQSQEYDAVEHVLLVDEAEHSGHADDIAEALQASRKKIECRPVKFTIPGRTIRPVTLGKVLDDVISKLPDEALFGFVGPRERLMANHLRSLAGCLARRPDADCAYADATLQVPVDAPDGSPVLVLQTGVDLLSADPNRPFGFGRFLFRKGASTTRAKLATPYLHHRPLAALVAQGVCVGSRRTTALSLLCEAGVAAASAEDLEHEHEILSPCLPDAETLRRLADRPLAAILPAPPPPPQPQPPRRPKSMLRRAIQARYLFRPIERALRKGR